ncbi:MAG: IS1380 family transposase, partial [bacterium]
MSIQIFTVKEGNEYLSSHAGLALIGALLSKTSINERVNQIPIMYKPPISNGDIISTMIGLCCLGKPYFDAVEP